MGGGGGGNENVVEGIWAAGSKEDASSSSMMEWLECVNEVLCFLCGDGGCWCWGRRMIVEVCGCGWVVGK